MPDDQLNKKPMTKRKITSNPAPKPGATGEFTGLCNRYYRLTQRLAMQ